MSNLTILVCGFMGAGKSTLKERLSKQNILSDLFDLDEEISHSLSIGPEMLGEWIEKNGLENFRSQEEKILKKILEKNGRKILFLGGGTLDSPSSVALINNFSSPKIKTFFLNTPFEECYKRIAHLPNRPLVKKFSEDELKALYEKRLKTYQNADFIIPHEELKTIDGLERLVHNFNRL